jgi:uncharacterized RDD family membrane protein YckC
LSDQTSGPDDRPNQPPPPPPPPPAGFSADAAVGGDADRSPAGDQRYGGVLKRFGARILDGLIVGIPLALIMFAIGLDLAGYLWSLVTTLVTLGYFVFLESSQQGTLGKRILGMSVVAESGQSLTPEASLRRNWWLLLGLIPFVGGLASLGVAIYIAVTISSDARNQGFHDKMADAVVLDR